MTNPIQYINLNSRSLTNKLTKFQSFVYSSSYDVICITETWSTDYIYDKEILPNKFTLYRRDKESRGGGVLIAVNDLLPSISPPSLEVVSIKLCLSGTQICINCSVYLPPNPDVTYFKHLIAFYIPLLLMKSSLSLLGILICLISVGPLFQVVHCHLTYSVTLCLNPTLHSS